MAYDYAAAREAAGLYEKIRLTDLMLAQIDRWKLHGGRTEITFRVQCEQRNQMVDLASGQRLTNSERAEVRDLIISFERKRLEAICAECVRRLNQLGFTPEKRS